MTRGGPEKDMRPEKRAARAPTKDDVTESDGVVSAEVVGVVDELGDLEPDGDAESVDADKLPLDGPAVGVPGGDE